MKTFTNELGNEISIEVSKKPIDGVEGVVIYMAGPTSTSENHITRIEAIELLKQLKEVLENT